MCDICVLTKQCVTYAAMVFSCLYCPKQYFPPQTCTFNCGRREITGYSYQICKDMARCAPRTSGQPTWSNTLWEPPWALALISCFAVEHPGVLGLAPGRPSLADCATSCYCVLPLHLLILGNMCIMYSAIWLLPLPPHHLPPHGSWCEDVDGNKPGATFLPLFYRLLACTFVSTYTYLRSVLMFKGKNS